MMIDNSSSIFVNFRSLLITTLEPIEKLASLPVNSYKYFQQDFTSIASLKKINSELKSELFFLKAKQQRLNHFEMEVARLNKLLRKASQLNKYKVKLANISHYNISVYSHFVSINKGYSDGVEKNQAVIDAYGLLGIVTQTTPSTAKVQLITDTEIQVPVRIQRTGQRGIIKGFSKDLLYLQFISNSSSVELGDIIETSGLANTYPKGYPVAKISQIKTLKDQPYFSIFATPIAKVYQAENILIISKKLKKVKIQ
jgi:rod shape-determining protein MreC